MVHAKTIFSIIFLAFFTFGAYKLALDDQVSNDLKQNIIENLADKPIQAAIFVKSLDDITPSLNYKLPFTDKKIFMINEFVLPGYTHIIIILILLSIVNLLLNFTKITKTKRTLILLSVILIGYFIASFIVLALYSYSSHAIGMSFEEATVFRRTYSNNFDNFLLPIIIIGLISALTIFKSLFIKIKNARSS